MKNKKKNLKLSDLKVQSFVTALTGDDKQTLKGGETGPNCVILTAVPACQMSKPVNCTLGIACTVECA